MQSIVFGGSLVMVIAPERGQVGATLLTIENRATARKSSDCSQVLPCILPECAALFLSACLSRRLETTLSGGEVIVSLASWRRTLHAVRWLDGFQGTSLHPA